MTSLTEFEVLCRKRGAQPDALFEEMIERVYRRRLAERPGSAIDLGAHKGRHLFPLADAVGEGGVVCGFEPIPELAESLMSQVDRARNVIVFPYAAGAALQQTQFTVVANAPAYSGLRERRIFNPSVAAAMSVRTIPVIVVPLDTALRAFSGFAVMKLDLEGGEFDALRGARSLIARDRPWIVLEHGWHAAETYGYARDEFFAFFEALDYEVTDCLGAPFDADAESFPWYLWATPVGDDAREWIREAASTVTEENPR